jgi:RNA polymerase sigma factor (sigma-70 family)
MKRKSDPSFVELYPLFVRLGEGDESAFKELFYKLSFLPQRIVRQYWWAGNKQDLMSAAYIALLKSIKTYDFSKCNFFNDTATTEIYTAIGRAKHEEKKWMKRDSIDPHDDNRLSPADLEQSYIEDELVDRLAMFLPRLEKTHQQVLVLRFGLGRDRPSSLRDTAKKLGTTVSRV